MSRKIILLNLALLALAGALVWQARRHYLENKAHEREILRRPAQARAILAPPAIPAPPPVAPVQYLDVAQRTLFTKDRNPTVVIEPPAPKPDPPLPAMPTYYGQLNLGGDPVIFLSIRGAEQKRYQIGDKVGDFQLVSFDRDTITLGFNDKKVERKLSEMKAKAEEPAAQAATAYRAPAAAAGQATGGGAQVKSLGGGSSSSTDSTKPDSAVGATINGTDFHGCVMGDTSPAGTEVDGYKKVVTRTLMGNSCYWEKVKK